MKIMKVFDKKIGDTTYIKYRINLPKKIVEDSGLKNKEVEIRLEKKKIIIENFFGFIRRKIVPNGTSARVNCPKEYLGKEAYLIILDDKNEK